MRALLDERLRADQALTDEHAVADGISARERQERRQVVAVLLGEERAATDKSLMLERADAEKITAKRDEFLGMVSHDLRNELGAITLSVAGIITTATKDDSGQKVLRAANNIQRTTLRMSRLIGDLLDIASIEAGKFAIVPEEHDVDRVVEEFIESFQPIAAAKDICLEGLALSNPLTARFDRQRILQVLGNLLTNALKFTSPGGRVTIHAERTGNRILFAVADTGVGIRTDRLANIFERFSQGSGADRHGLGLGLFIARHIVEAHLGKIWVESEVGRGSTFRFTLPA
jgi:signal transduction histidine kinase